MKSKSCKIGHGGSPWLLVCPHVTQGATAIVDLDQYDDLNCEGSVICPICDATLPRNITAADIVDFVCVCSHCCRRFGWLAVQS